MDNGVLFLNLLYDFVPGIQMLFYQLRLLKAGKQGKNTEIKLHQN